MGNSRFIRKLMQLIPVVMGLFLLMTGSAEAADQLFYTQSYAPYQMVARDLVTGASAEVVYTSATGSPRAVAVDSGAGKVYFSDPHGTVAKIFRANCDGTGTPETFLTGVWASDIALDTADGYLYYSQPTDGSVYRVKLADGSEKTAVYSAGATGAPKAVEYDAVNQKLYVADYKLGKIFKMNKDGSNQAEFLDSVHGMGLAVDPVNGKFYYSQAYAPTFNVVRVDLADGGNQEIIYTSATGSPGAIAIDGSNGLGYFSDRHSSVAALFKFNLTGSANPVVHISSVNASGIGIYNEVPAVVVDSLTIKAQPTLAYTVGDALDLSGLQVTVNYSDASSEDVAFTDFAAKGLAVDKAAGTILALADDGVKITVTHGVSGKTIQTEVLDVNSAAVVVDSLTIKAQPTLAYTVGDALDLSGLQVTVAYSDASSEDVAFTDFAAKGLAVDKAAGTILALADDGVKITVTHGVSGKTIQTEVLDVNSAAVVVDSLTIKVQPTLDYTVGDALDLSGLQVTVAYSDASSEDVAFTDFAAKGLAVDKASGTILALADDGVKITVTHGVSGKTIQTEVLDVNSAAVVVDGLTIKAQPTLAYTVGDALDLSGLQVTVAYSDASSEDVAFADFGAKGLAVDMASGTILALTDDGVKITVTHGVSGKTIQTTVLAVNSGAVVVDSLTIKVQPTLDYTVGDALDLSGLQVTVNYSDASSEDVAFTDFGAKGLAVDMASGTILALTDDGVKITVTHDVSSETVKTAALSVSNGGGIEYTITLDTPVGGTIAANKATAEQGASVILTITPDPDKQLKSGSLMYNDGSSDTPIDESTLTFSMPGENITIKAEFEDAPTTPAVVESLAVKTQPTLTYGDGDTLDLSGLVVTLNKSGNVHTYVAFADFAATGLTTDRANGESLTMADDGGVITITHTDTAYTVQTEAIHVGAEAVTVYTITIDEPSGGTITADKSTAAAGEIITLSVTPNAGRTLRSGSLEYNDGTDTVKISGKKFTMPAANVTVTAAFKKKDSGGSKNSNNNSNTGGSGAGTTPSGSANQSTGTTGSELDKISPSDEKALGKALDQALNKKGEIQIDISKDLNQAARFSAAVMNELAKRDKPLTVVGKGVTATFPAGVLSKAPEVTGALAQGGTLTIGAQPLSETERRQILANTEPGESSRIFEVGGQMFEMTAQVTSGSGAGATITQLHTFSRPVSLIFDLSGVSLTEKQIRELCGVRVEKKANGKTALTKLGGTYDPATKTFTVQTNQFSQYAVMGVENLVEISMDTKSDTALVNGVSKKMDALPITRNDRTLVPLRFIGEALGATIEWDPADRKATIRQAEKTLVLYVDKTGDGQETSAVISNDRTYVPVRYISEAFGAQVTWSEADHTITVIK